ncbi:MAG: shikimate kinase [Limnochordia bacterium]|jgi:shikimate kinase
MVQNLILIGFMAAGKTSVGRLCAQRLGWTYLDTDQVIEDKLQCSIAHVFRRHGEEFFRRIELEVLEAVLQDSNQVIATGGGIVTQPAARTLLEQSRSMGSRIVWLQARPEVILQRVGRSQKRPLIKAENPMGAILELLANRECLYRQIADYAIDTSDLAIDQVVESVLSFLNAGEA